MEPQAFAPKWQGSTLKERSAAQEHFADLCRMIGHGTPAELDPKGEFFTFDKGAAKQGGGDGWADVWYKGHFAWEYKGPRANLEAAYAQLLQQVGRALPAVFAVTTNRRTAGRARPTC